MAQNVVVPPFDEAPVTVVGSTPQSVFPFDFPFWDSSDLVVYIDGVELAPTAFTVQGYYIQNGDVVEGGYGSGAVTLNTAVSNCSVTLDRLVVASRESQFSRAAPLGMPALNSDLNKLAARQQDLARILSRAVVAAIGNDAPSPQDVIDAATAIGQKLDKATAAEDGILRLDPTSQPLSILDYVRNTVYLVAWKSASNTWVQAFDLAQTYLNSQGGGDLIFPRLDIPCASTFWLKFGRINLIGAGRGSTVIKVSGSFNAFLFKAVSGSYLASSIREMSVDYVGVGAPAAGYAVLFDGVGDCEAHNLSYKGTYSGIGFKGDNRNCRVFNCGGAEVVAEDYVVMGGGNQHIRLGTTYDPTASTTTTSILVRDTERLDLDHFTSSLHGVAVEINPAAGRTVQNILMVMPDLDASKLSGLRINPAEATGVTRNVVVTGGLLGASASRGIEVLDGPGVVGEITLNGTTIRDSGLEGAYFRKGRIIMAGCPIGRNGTIAGASGVRLGAGVESFVAVGVSSGPMRGGPDKNERPMPLQNSQLYGLEIDSGFAGTLDWTGGSLAGNLTGPVLNNSSVVPNISGVGGYVTSARGTATIAIGASSITVTPGAMAKAINAADSFIFLSCASNPDLSGVETVWRGATTSTTFDIVTSPFLNVSGQALQVAWEVRQR